MDENSQGEAEWNFYFQCNRSGIYSKFHAIPCYPHFIPYLSVVDCTHVTLMLNKFYYCYWNFCMGNKIGKVFYTANGLN